MPTTASIQLLIGDLRPYIINGWQLLLPLSAERYCQMTMMLLQYEVPQSCATIAYLLPGKLMWDPCYSTARLRFPVISTKLDQIVVVTIILGIQEVVAGLTRARSVRQLLPNWLPFPSTPPCPTSPLPTSIILLGKVHTELIPDYSVLGILLKETVKQHFTLNE